MDSQSLQNLFLLHKVEKPELNLLVEYSNHLIHQIDDTKLHSFYKDEVKVILQQAIAEIMDHPQNITVAPKAQSWLSRLFQKNAG